MNSLDAIQQKVLNLLLNKYENSQTYSGKNQVKQTFSIRPEEVYPNYSSNYEDLDRIHSFEDKMTALQKDNYIQLSWKYQEIRKIILTVESVQQIYTALSRQERNDKINQEKGFYQINLAENPMICSFCTDQLERLNNGKKSLYTLAEAQTIIRLLKIITENQQDILERELSITAFADSKEFERSWRSRICRILQKYGDFEDKISDTDPLREKEIIILESYHIFTNPSYVYLHGNGFIQYSDGKEQILSSDYPISLPASVLAKIKTFTVYNSTLMTIENLTSFNRMNKTDTFMIFLAGYHNTAKQKLILQIAQDNPNLKWKHFGDLDPDGFLIMDRLSRETNLSFEPYRMGIEQLKKYAVYCKKLNENDRTKGQNLIAEGKHVEIMQYMLDQNCKLEQEIISWMERTSQ